MKRGRKLVYILIIFVICLAVWVWIQMPTRRRSPDRPLRVGLLGIFKNEEMVLREWIDHYRWQGIDAILLLDNNSTDNFRKTLSGTEGYVTILHAKKNAAQKEHYNNLGLPWCKQNGIDILIIADVDEYFFVKDGTPLSTYLRSKFSASNAPAEVYAHWTMFGSSGYQTQPSSIRSSFTWRRTALDENPKSIVWVPAIKELNLHRHSVRGESECVDADVQLNHYAIMSKEYFKTVKMTRGAADRPDNVRDWDYFRRYDYKDEEDGRLRDFVLRAAETNP